MVAPRIDLDAVADVHLAGRATLDAAIWLMAPKPGSKRRGYEVRPFHEQLATLCDRLVESAFAGTSLQVTVGAPPRHGKTELIGLAMIIRAAIRAWREDRPFAILYITANDVLAKRIVRRLRAALTRLREVTGEDFFAADEDGEWTASSIETIGGFQVRAVGRGAATGGIGAHLLVMDDLIGSEANYRSPAERAAIREAVDGDYLTRLMDGGAAIHMETRRGTEDTTAWLHEEYPGQWEPHVWECYNEETGEYLWERRMNAELRVKRGLGDSSPKWLSLYQQRPISAGGTQIPADWLDATYSEPPAIAARIADRVVVGVDATFSGRTTSDHVAIVVLGIRGAYRDVLHVHRERMGIVDTQRVLREIYATWKPVAGVVELAGNGQAIVDQLSPSLGGLRGESPNGKGDKIARLTPWLPTIAARQVRLPAQPEAWSGPFRQELAAFSGTPGEPDDQVDALVWALVAGATRGPSAADWARV